MGKMTVRKIDQLIQSLNRTGGCVKTSCASIGISRTIFYKWKEKSKKLAVAFEEARHNVILDIEESLFDNAKKGNVTAQIFILTNVMPDKYKHVSKINGGQIEKDLDGKTNDWLLAKILEMSNTQGIDISALDSGDGIDEIDFDDVVDDDSEEDEIDN